MTHTVQCIYNVCVLVMYDTCCAMYNIGGGAHAVVDDAINTLINGKHLLLPVLWNSDCTLWICGIQISDFTLWMNSYNLLIKWWDFKIKINLHWNRHSTMERGNVQWIVFDGKPRNKHPWYSRECWLIDPYIEWKPALMAGAYISRQEIFHIHIHILGDKW